MLSKRHVDKRSTRLYPTGMNNLAVRKREECWRCGKVPVTSTWRQPAMLYHGGYGADTEFTVAICLCGIRETQTATMPPRECGDH